MEQNLLIETTSYIDRAVDRVCLAWGFHSHMNPDGRPMDLCFSGGKDSTCLFYVCKKAADRLGLPMEMMFHVRYNITNIDPPEVVRFIREMKKEYPFIELVQPKKTIWKMIVDIRMPPTRARRYCCKLMKDVTNMKGGYTLTGVRRAESKARSARRGFETSSTAKENRILLNDNAEDRRENEYCMQKNAYICNPIIDWSEEDVWNFIRSENLPYCSLYDEGWNRVGCIGCPLCSDTYRRKQFERWPEYKKLFIRTFDKMVENLDPEHWPAPFEIFKDGKDVFDFWMHDPAFWNRRSSCSHQGELFEEEGQEAE